MINLLPDTTQKNFFFKRAHLALSTSGLCVTGILVIGFILLSPALIALRYLAADLSYARDVGAHAPITRVLEERTQSLQALESQAREMLAHGRLSPSFEEVVAEVMKIAPAGIDLTTMRFEERTFTIDGHYQHRSLFLAFLETLTTRPFVKDVASPLSNLLKETDALFSVTFSL